MQRTGVNIAGPAVATVAAVVAGLGYAGWRVAGGWGLAVGAAAGVGLAVLALPVVALLWAMSRDDR